MYTIAIIEGKYTRTENYTQTWLNNEFHEHGFSPSLNAVKIFKICAIDYIGEAAFNTLITEDLLTFCEQQNVPAKICQKIISEKTDIILAEPEEIAYILAEMVDAELAKASQRYVNIPRLYRAGSLPSLWQELRNLNLKSFWIPSELHSIGEKDFAENLSQFFTVNFGYSKIAPVLDTILCLKNGKQPIGNFELKIANNYRPGMYASLVITEAQQLHIPCVLLNREAWALFAQELQAKIFNEPKLRYQTQFRELLQLRAEADFSNVILLRYGSEFGSVCVINVPRMHIQKVAESVITAASKNPQPKTIYQHNPTNAQKPPLTPEEQELKHQMETYHSKINQQPFHYPPDANMSQIWKDFEMAFSGFKNFHE